MLYKMYEWLDQLEFQLLELPKPDISIFLHMPIDKVEMLKLNRETLDENEQDSNYLANAEKSYLELANIYNFEIIECAKENEIRSIEDINGDIYNYIVKKL